MRAFFYRQKKNSGIFFVDVPGGIGKIFVTLLLLKLRQQKRIAVAVPFSGFAATILSRGRTAHSAFKLPLNLVTNDSPICNISKNSGLAEVLCQCHLIIWDECTMSHRGTMDALVNPRRTRSDEIKTCIKFSHLWNKVLKFSFNVRALLHGDQCAKQFSTWLLQLGNGEVLFNGNGDIILAHITTMVNSSAELKSGISRLKVILTPKDETVARINHELMYKILTVIKKHKSVDSVLDENQAVHCPTEFLSSLYPPGTPPHKLFHKVGVSMMLLRHLDPPKLCNGTTT
uniref:ATP-dependent DNA helicase n=1 Tax=Octopus bimaculoides TaxID=37653 RepID=A0A0L8HNX0_OCTBM